MVVVVIVVLVVYVVVGVVVVVVGLCPSKDAYRHLDEHAYDPFQEPLAGQSLGWLERPSHDKSVEACGTLQRGTSGNVEKPPLVSARPFSIALGDVEGNGGGRAVKLFGHAELAGGQRPVEQFPRPAVELQGDLVDVECLMVEHLGLFLPLRLDSDYDYDYDYDHGNDNDHDHDHDHR